MSDEKHMLFLTGQTVPDVVLECTQMENGEPRPPTQYHLCKRQQGEQSVGIKVMAGTLEPSPAVVDVKVEYVKANSTPDAMIFFPLCQDCRFLLDIWSYGTEPRRTTQEDTTCE